MESHTIWLDIWLSLPILAQSANFTDTSNIGAVCKFHGQNTSWSVAENNRSSLSNTFWKLKEAVQHLFLVLNSYSTIIFTAESKKRLFLRQKVLKRSRTKAFNKVHDVQRLHIEFICKQNARNVEALCSSWLKMIRRYFMHMLLKICYWARVNKWYDPFHFAISEIYYTLNW